MLITDFMAHKLSQCRKPGQHPLLLQAVAGANDEQK
jgi:hypothetical protein